MLQPNKSPGPDSITNEIIKQLHLTFPSVLHKLFNVSEYWHFSTCSKTCPGDSHPQNKYLRNATNCSINEVLLVNQSLIWNWNKQSLMGQLDLGYEKDVGECTSVVAFGISIVR
ncbi:hypothetical protein TNCT_268401 [Trichonephila clavata]|uniref:Uncharacterized protein n=1 Tax=Trichonephila clavata TaxID=2740835 RepID=A0A8X6J3U7_TRICU|nr:hypothetical protein TNCT_268401 [Trichonephila clavata]